MATSLQPVMPRAPVNEDELARAVAALSKGCDARALADVVNGFIRLGLPGLAVRLLAPLRDHPQVGPMVRRMIEQATTLHGEVDLAAVGEIRFQTNLAAMQRAGLLTEEAATLLGAVAVRVELHRGGSGVDHAVLDDPNRDPALPAGLRLLFPLADHASKATTLVLPPATVGCAFRCIGVPHIALLERVLAQAGSDGHQPPVDVVETDEVVAAAWLRTADLSKAIGCGRLAVFFGAGSWNQYREYMGRNAGRAIPSNIIRSVRFGTQVVEAPVDLDARIREFRSEAQAACRACIDRSLNSRDGLEATRRTLRSLAVGQPAPLRVLGLTSRYSTVMQHALRDLGEALRRKGCTFDIAMQDAPHQATVDIGRAVCDHRSEVVLVVNHLRSELDACLPPRVPYVCWVQDHMAGMCTREAGASVSPHEVVVTHSPGVMSALYGYPPDRMLASSNLTDAHMYRPLDAGEVVSNSRRCDVLYVGHGSESPAQMVHEAASKGGERFGRFMQQAFGLISARLREGGPFPNYYLLEILLEAERTTGPWGWSVDLRRAQLFPELMRMYDRVLRHQTLEWVAQWAQSTGRSLRIHGRGWRQHATLGRFAAGEIENGSALREACLGAKVVLQVNGYGSLHQRLLDGLACGALVLTRRNPIDDARPAMEAVRTLVLEHRIKTLAELHALATHDETARTTLERAAAVTGFCFEPTESAARKRQVEVLRQTNPIATLMTDDGLLQAVRTLDLVPARTAGQIDQFTKATFHSPETFAARFEALVGTAEGKRISAAMREDILRHDTTDVLAERILQALAVVIDTSQPEPRS